MINLHDIISQLWKDTNNIEFVRQSICHAKIDTTSKYIANLSDRERKVRIDELVISPKYGFK